MTQLYLLRVFPLSAAGGNPAPIVLDAAGLSAQDMRRIAEEHGHESGFVLPAEADSDADFRFRFFVPRHEMEMCGHATIGALWVLRQAGLLNRETVLIDTLSGRVTGRVPKTGPIAISQPKGVVEAVPGANVPEILDILGISSGDLARPDILNASTSRIKTLIALKNREILDGLAPDFARMELICAVIGSTGLYPFAAGDAPGRFHARQFPRASGYPEDAATGIAAAALAFGLLDWGMAAADTAITIRQGEAMSHPSEIHVRFEQNSGAVTGCWISGVCEIDTPPT